MRVLADEGVDGAIVNAVRAGGHDVRWMAEEPPGTKDDAVLEAAVQDARVLVTEDKDFGELVYRQRLRHRGVVLIRVDGISNAEKARIVARALQEHAADVPGAFTVIQHETIRIRRSE
jgi:predicted nuclease of predicted toxin-antitoxin system